MILQEEPCGKQVRTSDGNTLQIHSLFDAGGQAALYTEQTGNYLVKLYNPDTQAKKQKLIDKFTLLKQQPLPDSFIKVIDVVTDPYVGFVMEKLEGFSSLAEFMENHTDTRYDLRKRLVRAFSVAKSFRQLHEHSLAYCDISPRNILFKDSSHSTTIRIIDIDNIYVPGLSRPVVGGSPYHRAPELLAGASPDIFTDHFALAIIIFEMLCMRHPYVSKAAEKLSPEEEQNAADKALYGYIEEDESGALPIADVFTPKLRALARRCFVDGYTNPMARPTAAEWEIALIEASNQVVQCPKCKEYTYAFTKKFPCCACKQPLERGPVLRFYNRVFGEKAVYADEYDKKFFRDEPLNREFVLRKYMDGEKALEPNYIRLFYFCDLDPVAYNDTLSKKKENAISIAPLTIGEYEDGNWYYRWVPQGEMKCRYESQKEAFDLAQSEKRKFVKKDQLPNFKTGAIFIFWKSKPRELQGGKYICQRIAKVEEN